MLRDGAHKSRDENKKNINTDGISRLFKTMEERVQRHPHKYRTIISVVLNSIDKNGTLIHLSAL